MLDCVFALNDN